MTRRASLAIQHGAPFRFDGPRPWLRIVGIVRRPLDLASLGSAGGVVLMTPRSTTLYRQIANPSGYTIPGAGLGSGLANRAIQEIFGKDPRSSPRA